MTDHKRHVHADIIIPWANGAKVQHKAPSDKIWQDTQFPGWYPNTEYRIKPEPNPDKVVVRFVVLDDGRIADYSVNPLKYSYPVKVQYTFDGETGKLKSVEIIE